MSARRFFQFFLVAGLAAAVFSGCYEPIANTTDEFGSEKKENREHSNTSSADLENKTEENSERNSETNTMSETKNEAKPKGFRGNLSQNLSRNGLAISDIADESNPVEKRILEEYGAVFLTKAMPPPKVMFTSEESVSAFQEKAGIGSAFLSGKRVELQKAAAAALEAAAQEAAGESLSITPNDPEDSARRSYKHTLDLWKGRFEKACSHWKSKGKLTEKQISRLRALPIKEQVNEVLEFEKQGIYFSTFFNKSILYSVAAPGTSQHISMLAFDAKEFADPKVRKIMAKHGWFRTVKSDEPHFTYLGYSESELPDLGLKKISTSKGEFWIPDV